jgi:hypothetical protein
MRDYINVGSRLVVVHKEGIHVQSVRGKELGVLTPYSSSDIHNGASSGQVMGVVPYDAESNETGLEGAESDGSA